MQRRGFLLSIGLLIAALIGGGRWLFGNRLHCRTDISYAELPKHLQALSNQDFASAFSNLSTDEIIRELCDRDVYDADGFHIQRVRDNAVDEPLRAFADFSYTESELLLYAMVARLQAQGG